jgi:hypothetical protein
MAGLVTEVVAGFFAARVESTLASVSVVNGEIRQCLNHPAASRPEPEAPPRNAAEVSSMRKSLAR